MRRLRLRTLKIAASTLAGGLLLWSLISLSIPLVGALRDTTSAGTGASLLHGVNPAEVSYHMPLSGLIEDLLLYRAPPFASKLALAAAGGILILLIVSLSCLLGSMEAGLSSLALIFAGLLAAVGRGGASIDFVGWNVQLTYSLLFLIVAGLLVWREEHPGLGRTLALALAIGASLLCRSPLAFFPPVLALVEWRAGRSWKTAAVLALVPYLFLAPWIRMNWIVHHSFIPFEYREADCNVVTGALGLVPTIEGDWRALIDNPPDPGKPGAVLRWAAAESLRHPRRTASAYLQRLLFVLRLETLLIAAAACALWLFRARRPFRLLGGLCAYFIAIHCFMSVEEKYFIPVWLVCAALAASLPPLLLGRLATARRWGMPAAACVCAVFAAALGGSLLALRTVYSYGTLSLQRPPSSRLALESAISARPCDPWLLARRGQDNLDQGDVAGAVADFSKALSLQPDNALWHLDLAWALMIQGHPQPLLRFRWQSAPNYDSLAVRARLLKAIAYWSIGRAADARRQLALADESQVYGNVTVRRLETAFEREALEKLRAAGRAELRAGLERFLDYCRARMAGAALSRARTLLYARA